MEFVLFNCKLCETTVKRLQFKKIGLSHFTENKEDLNKT